MGERIHQQRQSDPSLSQLVPLRHNLGREQARRFKAQLEDAGLQAFVTTDGNVPDQFSERFHLFVRAGDWEQAEKLLGNIVVLRPVRGAGHNTFDDDIVCPTCGIGPVQSYSGPYSTIIPGLKRNVKPADGIVQCQNCASVFPRRQNKFRGLGIALVWGGMLGLFALLLLSLIQWLQYYLL